ncbi:HAD-IA family hydrolase [Candidatus Woesearchaeota archaeon]|nr:HAD-IA family hydrolase [Candidatus Woesearchaeota archaeon]
MIKGILFDCGGVVILADERKFFTALAQHSPYGWRHIAGDWQMGKFRLWETGKISLTDFYHDVCKRFRLNKYPLTNFKKDYAGFFSRNRPLERWIKKSVHDYKIWMLTDTNPFHYRYFQQYSIYRFITHKVISFQMGMLKPQRALFTHAIKAMGMRPEEIVFVDNNKRNIAGARQYGLPSIHYRSFQQFVMEFDTYR